MSDCSCRSHGTFLTAKGLREAAQRFSLEALAPLGDNVYLDKVGSVSALIEIENDCAYDPTHIELNRRLIHNGS